MDGCGLLKKRAYAFGEKTNRFHCAAFADDEIAQRRTRRLLPTRQAALVE